MRTKCNRGCGTCCVGLFVPLGVAVQRRPRKYSVLTGALVAGRAVRWRGRKSQTPPGQPKVASVKEEDLKVAEGRSPRKVETSTSQDFLNQATTQYCALSSHTDNNIPDQTANNDNGVDCRMHCFWMGHQVFQHSPRHVVFQD